jgi:hypothetical protein
MTGTDHTYLPCDRCHDEGEILRYVFFEHWITCLVCHGLKFVRVSVEPVGETRTTT